jgi:hypothetical protein
VELTLPECDFYVGIDWAAEVHAVCVQDAAGKITAEFTIDHTADGFATLLSRLGRLAGDPMQVTVALERPDGRLVDALLEAGHPVVPVSPNAIKTWRDGEVLSGAKSDLLTELPDLIPRASPVSPGRVARFRGHGQRRGCAAGVVTVGGAAARIAGSDGGSVRAVSAGRRRRGGDRRGGVVLRGVVGLWTAGGDAPVVRDGSAALVPVPVGGSGSVG